MLVTGNNNPTKDLILSIRLNPNGLYFVMGNNKGSWISDNNILAQEGRLEKVLLKQKLTKDKITKVTFCFLAKENMLVPEQFIEDCGQHHSEAKDGAVEVFSIPEKALETLKKLYGDKLHFSSALLDIKSNDKDKVYSIALYPGICTITITTDGKPSLSQHLPASNHADILYYLSTFQAEQSSKINIAFDCSKKLRKRLKPYYKNIYLCE